MIQAAGHRAEAAFKEAMEKGSVEVYRGRIMLIGQARAGKTSLKKSLVGLPFDPEEGSTVGIKVDPAKFEVEVDQVKNWELIHHKKLDLSEYREDIARITAEHFKALEGESKETADNMDLEQELNVPSRLHDAIVLPRIEEDAEGFEQSDTSPTIDESAPDSNQGRKAKIDPSTKVEQCLQGLELNNDVKGKEITLSVWDFAGQNLYYAAHSVFFSHRAVYVLVYNLSKDLSALAKPYAKHATRKIELENPGNQTNLDNLLSWLVSVHCIQPTRDEASEVWGEKEENCLPYLHPPVFVVGTHADKPFKDIRDMQQYIQDSISGKHYEEHVIRPLFAVDNTRSASDYGVKALQNRILEVLKHEPYMGEKVPIRWFHFEKVVEALVANKIYHMELNELLKYTKRFCHIVKEDELKAMLNFYHDLGVIVKHGRTVVLQALWLIDLFKQLIEVRPYDERDHRYSGCWQELEEKGILRMDLVDYVFTDFIQKDICKQDILNMMEAHGLIAKFSFLPADGDHQQEYFVPSLLKSLPLGLYEIKPFNRDPCPMYLHFLDGFVPHGLFAQLVSRCIVWFSGCSPEIPQLYQNGARFVFIGKQRIFDLVLICRKRFIKVILTRNRQASAPSTTYSATKAREVRVFLEGTLNYMREELSWLRNLRYELCVACPYCLKSPDQCSRHSSIRCADDDCLHLLPLHPEEQLICQKNYAQEPIKIYGLEKWLLVHEKESKDRKMVSGNPKVPPEIVVRGRLALEAYNKALAEGKTFDQRVPFMLIGQDRSGKTSLKKSLRGEPFNPDEESTVGIDVDPSHFQVSTEIWKAGGKDQETSLKTSISYEYHAARVTVETLKQEKSMDTTVLPNNDFISVSTASYSRVSDVSSTSAQVPQSPMATTVSPASYRSVSDVSVDIPKDLREEVVERMQTTTVSPASYSSVSDVSMDIPKDVREEMVKRMQNDHKMEDEEGVYSVLWDFAGQLVYYITHPLFLTSRAIYLLVNDLSLNPSETAKPVVKQGVYRTFEDSFGMKTNLDYLDYWLFSIASLECQLENERGPMGSNSEVLPEKLPPVFLVCTHADRPYDGGDPSTLARELFGSLQTKPYNKHLHDVFVVDNTKSGLESECPEVVRLRNEVLAVAKELPQMKEPIPIKWLKFEKELRDASKEGHKWISLETATTIASKKCNVVDSKEFKTLLNFLHDKRILIHFDDTPELDELVILDPQWLIDVFKKVITVKPYDHKGKKFTELWCKLENKGILDEKLLEQVWGPLFNDRATCERLLQIMGKFSLLCPWPSSDSPCGKQYLVPAMLRTYPPEDIMKLVEFASRQIPPLFLKFETGQVPPGLFPRLVLLFLQWGKQICLRPERTKLFHNFARFFTSKEGNWSVILLCLSSSIKVVVHRENPLHESGVESLLSKMPLSADPSYDTSDVTFPCEVHRQLGNILESMRKEFCWLKYMRYKASFICPVCCQGGAVGYCDTHHVQDCKHEECLHFWSHSQLCNAEGIISCTKSVAAINSRVQIDQFTPWFAPLGNQPTADHDGDNLASVEGPVGKRKRESPGSSCVKHPKRTRSDVKQRTDSACTSLKRLHLTPGRPVNRAGPVGKRKRESPGSSCVKHPKRTHAVKEGSPEKDDLERLANQIINEWRKLGRRLLESDDALLDAVHKDNEECSEKAYKMLLKWKEAKGSEATFRVLHDALCHDLVKRQDLAEKFCRVNDD